MYVHIVLATSLTSLLHTILDAVLGSGPIVQTVTTSTWHAAATTRMPLQFTSQRWHLITNNLIALCTAPTTRILSHRNAGIKSLQRLLDCYQSNKYINTSNLHEHTVRR